jgi:hypothetical protein
MALLAPQVLSYSGTTPSFAAAAGGGDSCVPAPGQFLRVKNASGSSITVTIVTPGSDYGIADPDIPVVVGATTGDVSTALPVSLIDANGTITWTYSASASVTVALIQVPLS